MKLARLMSVALVSVALQGSMALAGSPRGLPKPYWPRATWTVPYRAVAKPALTYFRVVVGGVEYFWSSGFYYTRSYRYPSWVYTRCPGPVSRAALSFSIGGFRISLGGTGYSRRAVSRRAYSRPRPLPRPRRVATVRRPTPPRNRTPVRPARRSRTTTRSRSRRGR